MSQLIKKMLTEQSYLLADGATGTNLFNMGLTAGDAPEIWNESKPEKIIALYSGAVNAGVDLFLTNSFGANAARLKLHERADCAFDLSRISAELAREVADKAQRSVAVAGSMGPTGELMLPAGTLSHEEAVEIFSEQAAGLKAGGVDLLWIETLSDPKELRAAAEAAIATGLPWAATMSFDTAGRTMMGLNSRDFASLAAEFSTPPIAFGANCGVGASDILRTVLGFGQTNIPIIAKGNAGIPKYVKGHIHYDGTPELMAKYARLARDAGAYIIGGCCGTTPAHLKAMRHALDNNPPGQAPTLETITKEIGPFSSETDGLEPNSEAKKRRNRRRR